MNTVQSIDTKSFPLINGLAYCPICTHTVRAQAKMVRNPATGRKVARVVKGQPCPRCASPLDAAVFIRAEAAAA